MSLKSLTRDDKAIRATISALIIFSRFENRAPFSLRWFISRVETKKGNHVLHLISDADSYLFNVAFAINGSLDDKLSGCDGGVYCDACPAGFNGGNSCECWAEYPSQ